MCDLSILAFLDNNNYYEKIKKNWFLKKKLTKKKIQKK